MRPRIAGEAEAFLGHAEEGEYHLSAPVFVVKGLNRVDPGPDSLQPHDDRADRRRDMASVWAIRLKKRVSRAKRDTDLPMGGADVADGDI